MRQKPAPVCALLWEWSRFSWWRQLNAQLAVVGIAVIVYGSLAETGPLEPRSALTLHMVLQWMQVAATGGALLIAAGDARRYYLLPLSNVAIAGALIIPGCVSMGASYVFMATILNQAFHVGWPMMGPTLFVAVFWAGILSMLQISRPCRWCQLSLCSVFVLSMGVWLSRKHGGGPLLFPNAWWREVTTGDLVLLGMIFVGEFGLMIVGIHNERCGMNPSAFSWSFPFDNEGLCSTDVRRFQSEFAALWWAEWKQKGWLIPSSLVTFTIFLIGGYALRAYDNRDYELLHSGLGYGIGLIPLGLVFGLVLGHSDPTGQRIEISGFRATLPVTNEQFARALLGVEALSLAGTWLVWVTGLGAATSNLYVQQGREPVLDLWSDHGKFTAEMELWGPMFAGFLTVMTLFLAWIGCALTTPLVLTGRQWLIVGVLTASIPTGLAALALMNRETDRTAAGGTDRVAAVLGVLAITMTILAVWTARTTRSITLLSAKQTFKYWGLLSVTLMACVWLVGWSTYGWLVLTCGLAGVALSPLATAPLALRWNRHR